MSLADEVAMQRRRQLLFGSIVAAMLVSWFAISNHCALGAADPSPKRQQDECPFHHPAPAKEQKSDATPCCKILRAIAVVPAAKIASPRCNCDWVFPEFVAPSVVANVPVWSVVVGVGPPGQTHLVFLGSSASRRGPPSSV